ncbi:UDP-xylose and UDP-N-acetylglucosamine transporter [Lucilia cuprina]|uniref:UDP-xylose and UDP-N-acetylglucosamine transporter n=1 Tax=Lucilia cuprina TaxID=7375 RepID=UPI001F05ABB2|nr:UDP-xylose and UDP-N-acetylglucosamine transporter [Lucilia cuprina]XP_046810612.1 UDP-xylose and UDP-N-acetylglucosamine transporter [Lucilia cuprina]XP_046810613.1 UDP-xylose and UDP-N-acetylglucosamine transporter [Lucilia cuprina]XP_046810614.1 UDP-xylose and UDP-N-acetylglucosamine transporter [Lucilia cuprina]
MNLKAWFAVLGVFIGCCSNVIFLELLVKHDAGAGNLITFSQFLFIAVEGYIFTSKFGTVKPVIGFKDYAILVLMFFVTSVCNNYAFNFNIPMPLHMIFRAGSLMANMIMGILILKKRYGFSKYLSVVLITVGIITCTLVSATKVEDTSNPKFKDNTVEDKYSVVFWWCVGIGILTVALLISACMGIYQEVLYKKFGKRSREALYYTHLLPLPGFMLLGKNIWDHLVICATSDALVVAGFNTYFPEQIFYLICNMITQYVCISSVYVLTAECSSLTVTLVVTLRKFVSLLFSILYFKNSFTLYHWIGTILVFTGTIIFTEAYPKTLFSSKEQKKSKTS